MSSGRDLVRRALERRRELLARLETERTDCYRLFHGVAEGLPGLTLDRYGPVLLIQTWKEDLDSNQIEAFRDLAETACGESLHPVWNDRRTGADRGPAMSEAPVGRELGVRYDVTPRHRGRDPLLFLDLRAGRRRVRGRARGKTVLNLFAYTGGVSLCAAVGGASEVWNVDFSRSAMGWVRRNMELNGIDRDLIRLLQEDVVPVLRQLAGLPVKGRSARRRDYQRFEPRPFDLVVLDPPRWAKAAFGAVDVVRDYPSLLKPALLATAPGGSLLVTNNAARVARSEWLAIVQRTAEKCGRPLARIEMVEPEKDFPTIDDEPPLKMAWIELA